MQDDGEYRGYVPPPLQPSPQKKRIWIDRPADLKAVANILASSSVLAIDAEFVSARPVDGTSTPRLALIQISDGRECFVIDAIRLNDLMPLSESFDNPDILKIFHGIGSDLRVLAARNLQVQHIIDLEATSRSIFGARESGLQTMVQRACHIHLDKTLQRSDWTQRPLPSGMIAYAARDAEMTYMLYLWLREYYPWAIALYEDYPDDPSLAELVAPWLLHYLQGDRGTSPELTVTVDALTDAELCQSCRDALCSLERPIHRARIYRTIADLMLTEMATEVYSGLRALTTEERSGAARAIGRLHMTEYSADLQAMLDDPVFDVRKSAVAALEFLQQPPRPVRRRASTEQIEQPAEEVESIDTSWKARLRDLLPNDNGPE